MALSIPTTSSGNGNFLSIVKYDARAGRMSRIDREQGADGWTSTPTDITTQFSCVMDLENLEVGWMYFSPGTPPDYQIVQNGENPGPAPSDGHKLGVRVLLKLSKDVGGDVRELTSTARVAVSAISRLHDAYLQGAADNPGKLPIVKLVGAKPVPSGQGVKKSTNYAPEFEITGWVDRPADLVPTPRVARAAAPASAPATPPATGSRIVPPPPAPKQMAAASANDWG